MWVTLEGEGCIQGETLERVERLFHHVQNVEQVVGADNTHLHTRIMGKVGEGAWRNSCWNDFSKATIRSRIICIACQSSLRTNSTLVVPAAAVLSISFYMFTRVPQSQLCWEGGVAVLKWRLENTAN